jgi:Rrf2 family iron-sulfur cluster assembly transcriptional regulator
MFVTRKMDYGLRILLTLGCRPNDRLTSEELAETIEVPRQFTLKIAQSLTKAGIIKAQRGVGGGIQLARDPETITLHDIFKATDTPRALNDCLIDPADCDRSPFCAPHQALREIQVILDQHLTRITLGELIRDQKILNLKRK